MTDETKIECPAGDDCESPFCAVHAAAVTLPNLVGDDDDDEPDTSQQTPESIASGIVSHLGAPPEGDLASLVQSMKQGLALLKRCGIEPGLDQFEKLGHYIDALEADTAALKEANARLEKALAPAT